MGKAITTYLIDGDPKGTQYNYRENINILHYDKRY